MKVHELAKWLLEFHDQDADIAVLMHRRGKGYYEQGGWMQEVLFNPEEHAEYTDMRGNQFVKPDEPYFNTRTLLLGGSE